MILFPLPYPPAYPFTTKMSLPPHFGHTFTYFTSSTDLSCDDGYTNYLDRVCYNKNETIDYVTGLTCDKGGRLENDRCVFYEVIDAKEKEKISNDIFFA